MSLLHGQNTDTERLGHGVPLTAPDPPGLFFTYRHRCGCAITATCPALVTYHITIVIR